MSQTLPVLLTDDQMRKFITNGFLLLNTDFSDAFHQSLMEQLNDVYTHEGNPGNNLLPRIRDVQKLMLIGMILALILQKEFKGRSFISSILVIPVMASPIVVAMLWKYMFNSFNGLINLSLKAVGLPTFNWLTNEPLPFIKDLPLIGNFLVEHLNANYGFLSAIIVNVWKWTPFVYLMLLAGLSSLPREPYEAAKVDGANGWQTFWNITFPLLKPVLGVVVLIRMIDLMKVYDQIYALFGESVTMRTLNLHIFSVGLTTQDYSKGAALSVIVLLLIICISLLFFGISKWVSKRGANV